jgi:hypothetical protein
MEKQLLYKVLRQITFENLSPFAENHGCKFIERMLPLLLRGIPLPRRKELILMRKFRELHKKTADSGLGLMTGFGGRM